MKIFDVHSDILTDVTKKSLQGKRGTFKENHFNKLKRGNIFGAILVIWVEPQYSMDYRSRTFDIIKAASAEFYNCSDILTHIIKHEDFFNAEKEGKFAAVLGLEGMSSINSELDLLYVLHQLGVRHGSLTWNEENELATGVLGDANRGLTKIGVEAIGIMEELGILLDVSHLNERSFWDVCNTAEKPFIASHSNAYQLCNHPRNLKDQQIKAIAQRGGVIGINAWSEFIDDKSPSIEKLADHIDYIVEMIGIDRVALGFDFCDFIGEDTLGNFSKKGGNMDSFSNASHAPRLIEALGKRGYRNEDVEKISYKNILNILKHIL